MELQAEWRDRLAYWTHTLEQDFYRPLGQLDFEGFICAQPLTVEQARQGQFAPMPAGTRWGAEWEYAWMKATLRLPAEAEGETIVLDLQPGGEATVFVNGSEFGTKRAEWVTVPHHYIQDNILCENARPGTQYEVLLEAYAGHFFPEGALGNVAVGPVLPGHYTDPLANKPRAEMGQSTYGVWNEAAYQLWLDVVCLTEVMENLSAGSLRAAKIAEALKRFTLAVDFEQPLAARLLDYAAGREILKPCMQAVNGSTAPVFYGVGNSHLDVVWLWPYEETRRKTARTFAQQLRLLEKYPEYRFLQSQPQTYLMCKEHYPDLYERIKTAVAQGRWIAEGAMWVEPDTNMSSGESLIRQLLYGMRFFREEFGTQCEILWLPDTFGYTAALPQILKGFGVKYLVTQKIFWSYNEGEQFPYHYFTWKGSDGSEIISFLPTSYTYKTNPAELMQLWENRVQKDDMDKFLLPFGYGDGGGGPTRDYIEHALRQEDLEGAPKVKMAGPGQLFEDLEAQGGPRHSYTGELYFTAHRGVYTTQAGVKKGNRRSEFALREAELWAGLAAAGGKLAYPAEGLEAAWKKVLLNQFHDILPGSSIARAYEEAAEVHRQAMATADAAASEAHTALVPQGSGTAVFNSLSWQRRALVRLPEEYRQGVQTADGQPVPSEATGDGVLALVQLPPCGYEVLQPAGEQAACGEPVRCKTVEGGFQLENGLVRAVVDQNGEVTSFVSLATGREFAAAPMNRLRLFKDVPRTFDAWDIDSPYEQQEINLPAGAGVRTESLSPLRCTLSVEKTVGNSRVSQLVHLAAGSSRLEFETKVEWNELHRLLKVSFPVGVRATEAINEMQFGYVKRPTHRSRQYDKDRFEVCNHRYTALCDEGHGAAVLNDCKYGVSVLDESINLTLLRAAASPEMRADNGEHSFTYAFTAWDGPFAEADVVRQGYELNVPPTVVPGAGGPAASFIGVEAANIVLETVKLAEDGSGDIILRLYESKQADTSTVLTYTPGIQSAWLCTMAEEPVAQLAADGTCVALHCKPFEVLTLRITPGR